MNIIEPTLEISNLLVLKDEKIAFHGVFKTGLNVITGENSSGKTTILDLIAYTLGMEDIPLKAEALSCDVSYLEIQINNSYLTLKREISAEIRRPISIVYEKFDKTKLDEYEWQTFSIGRSEKISYSQIMFNLMDSNELDIEASASLTFHQIMRCIYAAQPYLHFPILTSSLFDDSLTRKTIGEYLLGFYNNELYIKQVLFKVKNKEKSKLTTELNFLKSIFKKSFFTFKDKNSALNRINKDTEKLVKLREQLSRTQKTPKKIEKENQKNIDLYNKNLNKLIILRKNLEVEKNQLYLNSLDSQIFITELVDRLDRLEESEYIQTIADVNFEFCPSCLSRLAPSSSSICNLCKCEAKTSDTTTSPLLRMKNELLIQIEESKKININRDTRIKEIDIKINSINSEINSISAQLNELTQHWSDAEKVNISNLSFEIGQLDNEIKEIEKLIPIYDESVELEDKVAILTIEIKELENKIKELEEESYINKKDTIKKLNKNLKELLVKDIPREKEFQNPSNINISFTDNQVYVDNKNKFSESSMVVLRHLFHLALLKTADECAHLRFPHFLLLDGIDDGGIEPERNIRLQEIILETIDSLKNKHQVILATSITFLIPQLNKYVYNRVFTADRKSLDI
ncbi:AAA family ATPase [Acinetobacter calcoaceticus]